MRIPEKRKLAVKAIALQRERQLFELDRTLNEDRVGSGDGVGLAVDGVGQVYQVDSVGQVQVDGKGRKKDIGR